MPFIQIYSNSEIKDVESFKTFLKKFCVRFLSTKEHILEGTDFSITFHAVTEWCELATPIEIRITAHNFVERIENANKIAEDITQSLDKIRIYKGKIKTFLFLCPIGF